MSAILSAILSTVLNAILSAIFKIKVFDIKLLAARTPQAAKN